MPHGQSKWVKWQKVLVNGAKIADGIEDLSGKS